MRRTLISKSITVHWAQDAPRHPDSVRLGASVAAALAERTEIGVHAHENLSLSFANSVVAAVVGT